MKIFKIIILTIFSIGLGKLNAQDNLAKWIENNMSNEAIDVTVIGHKSTKTGQDKMETIKMVFTDMPELKKTLLDAYNKDKPSSYLYSESRSKGVTIPEYCNFSKDKDITKILFDFDGEKTTLIVQKIYNYHYSMEGQSNMFINSLKYGDGG